MPVFTKIQHAGSIDEILGDRSTRFFAEGYRKITRSVTEVALDANGARATASLRYPIDWSRKGSIDLRPHLSTIDALVLAVGLAEAHLAVVAGLDTEQRGRAWLRAFTMKAGRNPHEDLTSFPVEVQRSRRDPAPAVGAGVVSAYDCVVGAIKVRLEVEHEPGRRADARFTAGEHRFADLAQALGGGPGRYLERSVGSTHRLSEVTVAPGHISAVVDVTAAQHVDFDGLGVAHLAPTGFAAAYEPAISAVDCLVCMAQLAQTVLYSLDRVDRRESETLWMRTVWFEATRPARPTDEPFIALLEITKSRLLTHDGGLWRTADVAGDFHGLRVGSSLAHRLPAREPAAGAGPAHQSSTTPEPETSATAVAAGTMTRLGAGLA